MSPKCWLYTVPLRLRSIFHRLQVERELDQELQYHLDMKIEENVAKGMSRQKACRSALNSFGGLDQKKEECRDARGLYWLDSLFMDMRYALRGFRNSPGFALTVIGTLALGLGVLATSFTIFNAIVLRPFAVRDPYSLFAFTGWASSKNEGAPGKWTLTLQEFQNFRRENPAFSEVLGYQPGVAPIAGESASIQAVTGNYFNMLGARICMGRSLLESDDESGEGIAVASYAAWKSRFGSDPGIVGRTLRLGERSVGIVGVACPEFNGPQVERVDFWVSLALSRELGIRKMYSNLVETAPTNPRSSALGGVPKSPQGEFPKLKIVGRLKPGMTRESAEAALLAYGRQTYLTWSGGVSKRPETATIQPRATLIPLDHNSSVLLFVPIFLLFGLILLIACANVSNLMLARGMARWREIGIRIWLGAGRARMVRQFLTECLLLAIPAALAGFGVAYGMMRIGFYWLWTDIFPAAGLAMANINVADFLPDLRVLAFLLATALAATLVFGLVPAIQTTRLAQIGRGEFEAGCQPGRLRNALVTVQAMLCALLLILAGVALRNEMRLALPNLGLDIRGVFVIETSFGVNHRSVMDRLSSIASVDSIGSCVMPALTPGDFFRAKFLGQNGTAETELAINAVSPEYFDVYNIPVRGRKFPIKPLDAISSGPLDGTEAVLSETAARRLWPSGDALGQTIETKAQDKISGKTITSRFPVVGIAGDSVFDVDDPSKPNRAAVYFLGQPAKKIHLPANQNWDMIVVRMKGDPDASRRLLEKALEETTPTGMYFQVLSPQDQLDRFLYPYRAVTAIGGFLGGLALLLTTSGIFGMLSYVITQRKKELGIRIALGAGKACITGMVLRQSLRLAAVGSMLGALVALAAARVLSHYIQKMDFFDAGGYAAGVLFVIAAALAASWIPAMRAVNVDPALTLRCD